MHFNIDPPNSGPCILNTKKIFLARNKVKVFGLPRTPKVMAYGPWFLSNAGQKGPTPKSFFKEISKSENAFTKFSKSKTLKLLVVGSSLMLPGFNHTICYF